VADYPLITIKKKVGKYNSEDKWTDVQSEIGPISVACRENVGKKQQPGAFHLLQRDTGPAGRGTLIGTVEERGKELQWYRESDGKTAFAELVGGET